MLGFRLLSIILGFICIAAAGMLVFHFCPELADVDAFVIKNLIPDNLVRHFIKSNEPAAVAVKNIIKYVLSGYAIFSFSLGLLFLYTAINPLRMRPFILIVMIGSILWIAVAIWRGLSLGISKSWWIGDAAGALILLVLLGALFPRKKKLEPMPQFEEPIEEPERE